MLTLANEVYTYDYNFFNSVPEGIRKYVCGLDKDELMEIRIRCSSPIAVVKTDGTYWIDKKGKLTNSIEKTIRASMSDVKRGLELITKSSVYAFEDEMRCGYVTLPGGHRVGICGDAVTENGSISHLRSVQALNYRFAKEIKGAADAVMDSILVNGKIVNTLIVSPPMCGKTTMLRDIARRLSIAGKRVSIVDERAEIAALAGLESPFDLGAGCDVLSNVNKAEGMLLMLRAMSPDVIITDEIGSYGDFEAIEEIKKRGVSIITSLHGTETAGRGFDNIIHLTGVGKCLN